MFVIGESCSSKYLNFNLLGKEVGQKPMNQHLEECLSLILLMADSLIICKTAAEILDHGKDLKEDISKYKPQAADLGPFVSWWNAKENCVFTLTRETTKY